MGFVSFHSEKRFLHIVVAYKLILILRLKIVDYFKNVKKTGLCFISLLAATFVYSNESSTCLVANDCAYLSHHSAYWETKIKPEGSLFSVTVINDVYVEPSTGRVTIYSQSRAFGRAVAPAQIPQGECTVHDKETYCSHPSAVFLNASGAELKEAKGSGSWWVKQSWELDGEGFYSSEIRPAEAYTQTYMTGELLEDGLTIKVQSLDRGYVLRKPVYEKKGIAYEIIGFSETEQDDNPPSYEETVRIEWQCKKEKSPLTGETRLCPEQYKM